MCTLRVLVLVAALTVGSTQAAEDQVHRAQLQQPGQAAFGDLAEAIRLLEADPRTDWTKVDVNRLREHLIDMDEVFMRAQARQETTATGVRIQLSATGRALEALQRMVPAHAAMLDGYAGWRSRVRRDGDTLEWRVDSDSPQQQQKIRALGFFGTLTLGSHHAPHHLAMIRGEPHGAAAASHPH